MLVHRENDEPASGERSHNGATGGKPRAIAKGKPTDTGTPSDAPPESDIASDDGKTHLIGDALKSVYQRTLEEDIPDDFLDLLKQLK